MSATTTPRRTATRQQRRQQLIDATIKCISRKGFSGTTLADVAAEAGLSQGIVNLHFDSKDNLLTETLRHLADEYRSNFDKTFENAGPGPADQLLALMQLYFRPSICNHRKLAVWFGFLGEVTSRPTYRKICSDAERYYAQVIESLCRALIEEGAYENVSASAVTNTLMSITDGLWLNCLINQKNWDRQEAMNAVMSYLRSVFPQHYS